MPPLSEHLNKIVAKYAAQAHPSIALKVPKRANGGHVGALRGTTPGRADEVLTSVPEGSHIIPADIISALGDGNSEAGFAKLEKIFPPERARGGGLRGNVPVKLSDGEFSVPPEHVARIGGGDIERGHRAIDQFILSTRKADIERRKSLPGPVQS